MLNWISKIDFASLLLGTVLGALAGTWLTLYLKRPKLQLSGTASGGPAIGFQTAQLYIQNVPGLFGIEIRRNVIFGRLVNRDKKIGLSLDRSTARQCTAWILDPDTKEYLSSLFWKGEDEPKPWVDIGPGESAELLVLARRHDRPAYFVFAGYDANGFRTPPEEAWLTESRKFLVEVQHSYGRRVRFKLEVVKRLDGRLHFQSSVGGGSF